MSVDAPDLISNTTDKIEKEKPHYSGHRRRLRERFLKSKKHSLPDYEILEMLLFSISPRKDVKPLAKTLLARFGSLAKVITADMHALQQVSEMNESALAMFKVVLETSERLLKEEMEDAPILQSWKSLLDYCRVSMGYLKQEQFRILYLDGKNMVIADELQETGTIDQTPIYPREVIKRALQLEASSIILVHNHPSGKVQPSRADINVTHQVIAAGEPLGVKVHDHVIVSQQSHYSFKSHGIIG